MGSDYFIGGASGVTYTPGIPNMDGDVGKCVCVCLFECAFVYMVCVFLCVGLICYDCICIPVLVSSRSTA